MQTESETRVSEEIRSLLDTRGGHYVDKSARWLFKDVEKVRGLVTILAKDLVKHLDFDQMRIQNRSFVDDTLRDLQSDMVFTVPFRNTSEANDLLIYILIEHQSTVDPLMGFRLLFYMCQIWDIQRCELEAGDIPRSQWRLRPILPIVYYTGSQRWQTPISLAEMMDVPEVLTRFVPTFDTLFLGVKDTDTYDLTKTGHPLGWLLAVLQQCNRRTLTTQRLCGKCCRQRSRILIR